MQPWYKVVKLRKEVREGRSFNPDEFAIALEQVVAGTAPEDYRDPAQFFARTCFTRALRDHVGLVLRRLSGRTDNTAPVLTLITQFGGGKTHTLTALYHLVKHSAVAASDSGVADLMRQAGVQHLPQAKVAVFVGNAWDPQLGRETPWIDLARQLAGDAGVMALGSAALTTPPGTEAIQRVFSAASAPVLLLFDEVLNFLNRHRDMAEAFYAFIQNLTVAVTGTTHGAAVISLPRSQVEMTDWDLGWQDRITKVVRRVATDLIVNDEAEIGEVVRRRLFEDLGPGQTRRKVAREFSDWCFERRAQLPPEWTAVDSSLTEAKAREFLQRRFEACYPFHPATLSVFQRKWQALPQYQQTRGTLAMLAQWVSLAAQDGFRRARTEPLITLGSAPLSDASFRSVVLGQLGESRLVAAIEADIAGEHSHARALDADTKGALRDIHRRVGTAILFESSGGQTDKVAHLPELRFALGEPGVDTTSIDNAAFALEERCYFVRRVGSDGFRIGYQPTLRKVVSDRRASLDEETEVKPAMRQIVKDEFCRGARVPVVAFPSDSAEVPDSPKLTVVLLDPEIEWTASDDLRAQLAEWTKKRGASPRLYPGALVWCIKKQGGDLRSKVALALAWERVAREVADGALGSEFDRNDRAELQAKVKDAKESAKDEVWGSFRFAVVLDRDSPDGLKVIDLGAGHSSSGETLCGRVLAALKSEALLNESVGAGYLERNWPPAFKESGAWPLASLRQSFLNGSLTRLVDPDATLKSKIVEFIKHGDFGLASGQKADGSYERVWFREPVDPDEVSFEAGVFLLLKATAERLKGEKPAQPLSSPAAPTPTFAQVLEPSSALRPDVPRSEATSTPATVEPAAASHTLRITGSIPSESWNRFGTSLLSKLRAHQQKIEIEISFSATVPSNMADSLVTELRQILSELGLANSIRIG
jgi:hypothetical protein